ncbi:MAG TPA: hypothetical protein VFY13_01540 [Luteolibacter sp.]|nr:hypothetical protein [Luteolibacter sp.]
MELNLTELVVLMVGVSMGAVLIFSMISRTHRLAARASALSKLVICRLCLHAYENPERHKLIECPRCGALNQRGASRRLG